MSVPIPRGAPPSGRRRASRRSKGVDDFGKLSRIPRVRGRGRSKATLVDQDVRHRCRRRKCRLVAVGLDSDDTFVAARRARASVAPSRADSAGRNTGVLSDESLSNDLSLPLCSCAGLHLAPGLLTLFVVLGVGERFQRLDGPDKERAMRMKPWVRHHLGKGCSVNGVRNEHDGKQMSSFGRDVGRELERGVEDIAVKLVDVVAVRVCWVVVKGEVAREHGIEDDTTTPDVDGRTDVHALAHDELGGGIARTAATCAHEIVLFLLKFVGEPKVGDDDVASLVEEKVF